MPAKKKQSKRTKKNPVKKVKAKVSTKEKGPEYMVQISDPKMLRKDILETLRETIIFMQGYEKFRQIQGEKVALFAKLKNDIKELDKTINVKLRQYLPRGKLKPFVEKKRKEIKEKSLDEIEKEAWKEEEKWVKNHSEAAPKKKKSKNELEDLENQLTDIEQQLQGV